MANGLKIKIVNSLEKCFLDDNFDSKKQLDSLSVLNNEKASFQVVFTDETIDMTWRWCLRVEGPLKDYITVRQVINVPSSMPVRRNHFDENYLRTTPGLYPDLLIPLHYQNRVSVNPGYLLSLWFDVNLPENFACGCYKTDIVFYDEHNHETPITASIDINVLKGSNDIPSLPRVEWFYCDCLAQYYDVEVFGEEHWRIIENFVKTAVDNEINIILTPVFTPALDTYVGGERLTTQLVGITLNNGEYTFDFSLLDRWIEMCKRCGVTYLQMPPLFTQWGAKAAPKIMATVDGEYKRLFGWETDAAGEEYTEFLSTFIPALIERLKQHNIDKNTYYQISDEPNPKDYDRFLEVLLPVKKLLAGYEILDTVSHMEAIEKGIVSTPVVVVKQVENYIKAGIENTWCYYAMGPTEETTNRFLSMPLSRVRILGVQIYKFDVKGFLHWGYNYYNNQFSYDAINPYMDTTGEYFASSGDAFLVYPAKDGTAYETMRLLTLRDAFYDYKALKLCEKLYGREYVLGLIQEGLDYDITFKKFPCDSQYLLDLRKRVNKAINDAL